MLLDPLKGTPRHIDLHKVNMDEKVRVEVKIRLKGTAKGVKDGGLLEFVKHTVELECLPALIPAHIDVDVTALTIGHSIHVSDLQLPANVRLLDDQKAAIVSVIGKAKRRSPGRSLMPALAGTHVYQTYRGAGKSRPQILMDPPQRGFYRFGQVRPSGRHPCYQKELFRALR